MKTNKQSLTLEFHVPNGYKAIDFRNPRRGELFLADSVGEPVMASGLWLEGPPRLILEKIEVYSVVYSVPVMPGDYGKEIEVRDTEGPRSCWMPAKLCGIRPGMLYQYVTETTAYIHARIKVED